MWNNSHKNTSIKSAYKASIIISVYLLILGSVQLLAAKITENEIESNSALWPDKVAVNISLTGKKHGNKLKPGHEGILLRVEDGKCLVDFGHSGIFSISTNDTDLIERAQDNVGARNFDSQGLFNFRYTKFFVDPMSFRGLQIKDLEPYRAFALFYLNFPEDKEGAEKIAKFTKDYHTELQNEQIGVLLLPTGDINKHLATFITLDLTMPIIAEFIRDGAFHTLQHDIGSESAVVMIDKNGRILGKQDLTDFNAKALLLLPNEMGVPYLSR